MPSKRQTEANRRNGAHGGPKTPAGKARSSRNALTHGLFASTAVLGMEKADDFLELHDQYTRLLQPSNTAEKFLLDQLVNAHWRLSRIARIEVGAIEYRLTEIEREKAAAARLRAELRAIDREFGVRPQPDEHAEEAAREEEHRRRLKPTARAIYDQRRQDLRLGELFCVDSKEAGMFNKLARYESTLRRSYFRAYTELQRLREAAAQAGQKIKITNQTESHFRTPPTHPAAPAIEPPVLSTQGVKM
ncbi:MAG: hypothetical protein ACK5AZ_08605 [Bryobacteraceae bacterium]